MRSTCFTRAVLVLVAACLAACGESPPYADGTIAGRVWLAGPIKGVQVTATQLGRYGQSLGVLGTSAPTDDEGRFELDVGTAGMTLLLEAGGHGETVDQWTGAVVAIEQPVILRGLVPEFEPGTRKEVVVSPLSSMAAAWVEGRLRDGKVGDTRSAVREAHEHLAAHFCDAPFATTMPAPWAVPGPDAPADTAPAGDDAPSPAPWTQETRMALCLAGLSTLAAELAGESDSTETSVNTWTLTRALEQDLRGPAAIFDGQGPDGQVVVGLCPAVESGPRRCALNSNTVRSELGSAILRFIRSPKNRSGRSVPDAFPMVEAMRTNIDADLFGGEGVAELDRAGPRIVWEDPTPADGAVLSDALTVRARATDELEGGRVSLAVTTPGLADEDGDTENDVVTLHISPATWLADQVVVALSAADRRGNETTEQRTFTFDRGAPKIVWTTPTAGAAYRSDVLIQAQALDTHLLGFHLTRPAGLADEATELDRVRATLPITNVPEGKLTLELSATDAAGQTAVSQQEIWVDRTPPVLTVTGPAAESWVPTATVRVSGTARDVTTGIKAVVVRVGEKDFTATLGAPVAGTTPWEVLVTLRAAPCTSPDWEGRNSIQVRATDAAGNETQSALFYLNYDNCDPTIAGVPSTLRDERTYRARFHESSYSPCLYRNLGAAPIAIPSDTQLAGTATTVPKLYKYAINMGPTGIAQCETTPPLGPAAASAATRDTDGNPLAWDLHVTDNREGVTVTYQIKAPGDPDWRAPRTATPVAGSSTATHRIVLTSTDTPDLMTRAGFWEIEVSAQDAAGRTVKAPGTLRWNHVPMAGPVYVEEDPSVELPNKDAYTFIGGVLWLTKSQELSDLYGGSKPVLLRRYRVYNGTQRTALLRMAADAKVNFKSTRKIYTHKGPQETGWLPECPSSPYQRLKPLPKACLAAPPALPSPEPLALSAIPVVDAFAVQQASDGSAAQCLEGAGSSCKAWSVPATNESGGVGQLDVLVLSNGLGWIWPGGAASDLSIKACTDCRLFGSQTTSWIRQWKVVAPGKPTQYFHESWESIQYLDSFEIRSVPGQDSISFLLSPSPGVEFVSTTNASDAHALAIDLASTEDAL